MEQKRAAVIIGVVARLRHHDEIGFCIYDRLQRDVSAEADAEIARGVV